MYFFSIEILCSLLHRNSMFSSSLKKSWFFNIDRKQKLRIAKRQYKIQNVQGVYQPDRCTTHTAPAACGGAGTGAGIATRTDRPDWRTASPLSRRIYAHRKRCCRGRLTWWSWTSACSNRLDASSVSRSLLAMLLSAPPSPRGALHPRSNDDPRASAACCGQGESQSWSRCSRPSFCTFGTAS